MKDEQNLENKIMGPIKRGEIKLRSKYIFLAEKLGLEGGAIFTILLAVLFFNLILFYMKESDNLIYLTFGPNGFLPFLESFPYLLVVALIVVIFLSGFLISKTDFSYKKSFGQWALGLIAIIIIVGTGLTFTNINKEFQKYPQIFMHPFSQSRPPLNRGMVGIVIEKTGNEILLDTREGVQYINLGHIKGLIDFKINDFVIVIGEKKGDYFEAIDLKIIKNPTNMMDQEVRRGPKPFN